MASRGVKSVMGVVHSDVSSAVVRLLQCVVDASRSHDAAEGAAEALGGGSIVWEDVAAQLRVSTASRRSSIASSQSHSVKAT
jgi:hypothetical protein